MTAEQEAKLTALQNRATRYEVIAIRGDVRFRVGYTIHKSKHGLFQLCRANGQEIIKALGIDGDHLLIFRRTAPPEAYLGPTAEPWTIRFSGRTQREAIIEGELPWVGSVAEAH